MKPKILITVRGGVVNGIFSNMDAEITIVDYDNREDENNTGEYIGTFEGDDLDTFLQDNPIISNHLKELGQ